MSIDYDDMDAHIEREGEFDESFGDDPDDDSDIEDGVDDDFDDHNGFEFTIPCCDSNIRDATPDRPRNLPCPTCCKPERLSAAEIVAGYECDECAHRVERSW